MRLLLMMAVMTALAAPPDPRTIDTVAGSGEAGSGGDGGPAASALLREPYGCELDGRGHLFVADAADGRVRRVDLETGVISTVAGDGPGREVGTPYAVAVDAEGNLYVVDQKTPVVRRVDGKSGAVSVLAGTGAKGFGGDGGPAASALLREPNDCCLDGRGGLLIADVADWRVRRVDLETGVISTFAGTGKPPAKPDRSRIGDGGQGDRGGDRRGPRGLRRREGEHLHLRARGERGPQGRPLGDHHHHRRDGPAPAIRGTAARPRLATFRGPKGIRADARGNLYVVDTENHAIRRIDAESGAISTVAGGRKGPGGDGGDARDAGLDRPHGCVVDRDGTLYIADSENHRVRRVRPR